MNEKIRVNEMLEKRQKMKRGGKREGETKRAHLNRSLGEKHLLVSSLYNFGIGSLILT